MSRLSDKKLALLQSDYSSSLWYITKQNCSFRDLMMMASILERWNDDPNESFEVFFNRVKTETKYANYIGNSPHRALKNCEFYGIMSPSLSSKAAYTSSNLTDVYYTVKTLCNEDYADTNKYQQIIDKQIENMNISIDGNDLKPVLFTLKVMLVVGDATGNYELSLQEFKLFVCTAKKWCQYFESAESILRSREDSDYLSAALQNYDIANDTRFNLVFKNLSYVESTTKGITIAKDKIEEVRKKVAEFEVGEIFENKGARIITNSTLRKDIESGVRFYLTAIRTKPFILLAGISGTGKSRIVRKLAQATDDIDTFMNDEDRWKCSRPTNFELIQVKPNWHNSMDVVGFQSNIPIPHYEFTPFVDFVVKAWCHENTPFFLCLDEMNLAPVEEYFAEFLSAIESRSIGEDGEFETDPIIKPFDSFGSELAGEMMNHFVEMGYDLPKNVETRLREKGLTLPKNLIVMGTVNMDETTFSFSRKVLDRAMSIEMNEVDYDGFIEGKTEYNIPILTEQNSLFVNRPISAQEVKNGIEVQNVMNFLKGVNDILEGTPFKLGYRAANEAILYVAADKVVGADNLNAALDEFTLMKILSRIEGDDSKLVTKDGDKLLEKLNDHFANVFGSKETSKSLAKLDIMIKTLRRDHFVSFWG